CDSAPVLTVYFSTPHKTLPRIHFYFQYPSTPELSTLSLHDALPIFLTGLGTTPSIQFSARNAYRGAFHATVSLEKSVISGRRKEDRKSTRLNSSHGSISYAVFCLKKKTVLHELGNHECGHQCN